MNALYVGENFMSNNGWGTLAYNLVAEEAKKYKYVYIAANNYITNEEMPINSRFIARLPPPNDKIRNLYLVINSIFIIVYIKLTKKIQEINILSEPYFYLALFLPKKTVNFYLIGTHCLGPTNTLRKFLYRKSLLRCKKIMYISDYTLTKFKSVHSLNLNYQLFKPKIAVINAFYKNKSERKYLLIVVGDIKPRKGHDIIIEALRILKLNIINFECAFIGGYNSEYATKIKNKITEYGLTKNINLTDRIDDRGEVNNFFKDSITSVIISTERDGHFEGFGLVHIEANMLYSWPIGVRNSGNAAAIQDLVNGTLLHKSSAAELANQLINVLNMSEEEFHSRILKAREFAIENYGRIV